MNLIPLPAVLGLFAELFSPKSVQRWQRSPGFVKDKSRPRGHYRRIFDLVVTLWYLVFQRLNADKTLAAVVKDLRAGGADRFSPSRRQPLSKKVMSHATTSYSDARQRMPLAFLQWVVNRIGEYVRQAFGPTAAGSGVFQLIDGSTLPMLANADLAKAYPPARNQHGKSDWCVMRVVVGFCALTGVALSAAQGSIFMSEQALAWNMMAQALVGTVWIGDRNFGVWSVVAQALAHQQHVIVRLTQARARRLGKGRNWVSGQDELITWRRTKSDKIAPGTEEVEVQGRLIFVQVRREGRMVNLWLFTTLLDRESFPVNRLVELYGWRWQAEIDFRYLKTNLDMQFLSAKSPAMARKEFYAGLIAYGLVRLVMAAAEPPKAHPASTLSFSQVRRVIVHWLVELGKDWRSRKGSLAEKLEDLISEAAGQALPTRRRPRPNEPRRVRRRPQTFPTLKGSRQAARRQIALAA